MFIPTPIQPSFFILASHGPTFYIALLHIDCMMLLYMVLLLHFFSCLVILPHMILLRMVLILYFVLLQPR